MTGKNRGLINLSGLEECMREILNPYRIENIRILATYADSIYMPSEVLIVKGQHTGIYFAPMNALRENIEHENGLFVNL